MGDMVWRFILLIVLPVALVLVMARYVWMPLGEPQSWLACHIMEACK